MKVSKVNHRRAAVAVNKKSVTVNGILYDAPVKKNVKTGNMSAYVSSKYVIDNVVKNSSRLYSPFSSKRIVIDREKIRIADRLKQCYVNFVKYYLSNGSLNEQQMRFNPNNTYMADSRVHFCVPSGIDKESLINSIVDSSLRKSLKRTYRFETNYGEKNTFNLPDLVKKSIKIYCTDEKRKLNDREEQEMYVLFSYMYEDKYKDRQKVLIANSISNQATKVKVCDDESRLIKLSIADTKKKPLWDFIVDYANSDKNGQYTILRNIRKSIVLFVCGVDVYRNIENNDNLDIWKWEEYGIQESQLFVKIENCYTTKGEDIALNEIRNVNLDHYMKAIGVLDDERSKFWFQHYENTIEALFSKKSKRKIERIKTAYLCEYLWKNFCSYVALKYVDLGKGVYHFTMSDKLSLMNKNTNENGIKFGEVDSRFNKGISSFDYERIKAEETINRNISTYTTFATNIFAKSVIKDSYRQKKAGNSDALQYDDETYYNRKAMNPYALKRVLRYWGGQSRWKSELEELNVAELCIDIKNRLSKIRNSGVHYTSTSALKGNDDDSIVGMLIKKDFDDIKDVYASKYYSNNVWMFYNTDKISKMMEYLYQDDSNIRDAQIPAFNSVIKRKDMAEVIEKIIKKNSYKTIKEPYQREKYRSCLYFMLKEIYYNRFIKQDNLKDQVIQIIDSNTELIGDNSRAVDNLKKRIHDVDSQTMSFGELCQVIITDYNMQNQENKSIKSKERQDKDRKNGIDNSYKHFPLLLHHLIKVSFLKFIKTDEKLAFIREPRITELDKTLEQFEAQIQTVDIYNSLKMMVAENKSLLDWYTLAHFLMPKQLNHLIGDVKNYIQYLSNIDKRAGSVKNNKSASTEVKIRQYSEIVRILDFSLQYIGRVSNDVTDYFVDEDEYAAFLSKYVEFSGNDIVSMKAFCQSRTANGKHTIGLYCDGANPIMNRNIAYAKMYGNDEILSYIYNKVTKKDIEKYYVSQDNLEKVFADGKCQDVQQQNALCDFQKMKNHIELTEVSIYTDILNDFMAQFISWAYLRERDLMYFQLGLNYIRMFYGTYELEEKYYKLHGENINIEKGALLYQIVAMYSHELPIYKVDESGIAILAEKQGSSGASIKSFVTEYCKEEMKKAYTYENGLELFEDVNQHDDLSKLRNDFAHMRYMSARDKSIMDIVSEIYNGFFIYDTKLKKSVSFIFKNILMRYAVDVNIEFCHKGDNEDTNNLIRIKDEVGLYSDKYTYKVEDNDTVDIEVRNSEFLEQLKKLLEYKKESEGSEL